VREHSPSIYDRIGVDYSNLRKPDPRIAAPILAALGSASSVLNVGAGTGSYEPADRAVTAIEPSAGMIRQRRPSAAPAIQGHAEALPFPDRSFDAVMAILTVHHWTDKARGLREMRRVARGPAIVLTFDPAHRGTWLTDYLPQLSALDEAQMPPMADYERWLGPVEISPVPVPADCSDGFLHAYWRRPAAYLDPRIRRGISSFWALSDVDEGLARLEADLASGHWTRRYGHLLDLDALDAGYRLVVAR
jgi:SAM-dependent methyltransferase